MTTLKMLLRTVMESKEMNGLLLEGPPGWGKSTAVDLALEEIGAEAAYLGAYSTARHLFQFLAENANRVVVLDDCSGLFHDAAAMAILKAATWARAGKRPIKWGSAARRGEANEFLFTGKLVIICNAFPITPDGQAVRSRSFPYKVLVSESEAKSRLLDAAEDRSWFPKKKQAMIVARFLVERISAGSLGQISYRTLRIGYELAEHNPDNWRGLLSALLPEPTERPRDLVVKLSRQNLKVKEQARAFSQATGLKRRTFFLYRKELNLSR